MADTTKRARDAGDDRRPVRRDPRAEPDTPAPASAEPRRTVTERPTRHETARERRPSSGHVAAAASATRTSPARFERVPAADEAQAGFGPDATTSPGVAGAMGLAALRRQLAALQMHLAEAQGQLAQEQQGRAEDADALAVMLERVANSERNAMEAANLRVELEREREFVGELRISVREKYEDCNTLRQQLGDAEILVTKGQDEAAAHRRVLIERTDVLEFQLDDAKKQLDETTKQLESARARAEAGQNELAALSAQLEEVRRERESLHAEVQKANAALKSADIKAFAASKQLEMWKNESQRTIEQNRVDHQVAVEGLQREVKQGNASAAALRKQLDDAASRLEGLTTSIEAIDQKEREIDGLRELTQTTRRTLLEQARSSWKPPAPAADVPDAPAPAAATASLGLAGPPRTPLSTAGRAPRPPAVPPKPARPVKTLAERVASAELEEARDAPFLEIGETEMRAEDLVEELLEAQNRAKEGQR